MSAHREAFSKQIFRLMDLAFHGKPQRILYCHPAGDVKITIEKMIGSSTSGESYNMVFVEETAPVKPHG